MPIYIRQTSDAAFDDLAEGSHQRKLRSSPQAVHLSYFTKTRPIFLDSARTDCAAEAGCFAARLLVSSSRQFTLAGALGSMPPPRDSGSLARHISGGSPQFRRAGGEFSSILQYFTGRYALSGPMMRGRFIDCDILRAPRHTGQYDKFTTRSLGISACKYYHRYASFLSCHRDEVYR